MPRTPPVTPAGISAQNSRQFTLPCAMWLEALAPVVKTSAAWTLAEARAGATPKLSRTEEETTP